MIQFQTNILASNPAYNDSIIRYKSTITGMTKSEITISGASTFTVYPFDEEFSFNFKEIAKTLINQNGFKDAILPDFSSGQFVYNDPSLQITLSASITTLNSLTSETTNRNYVFTKSVEQLPNYYQKIENIDFLTAAGYDIIDVLLPSNDFFNYEVTYFEGYPFDFSIRGLVSGDTFFIENENSGMQSSAFTATGSGVYRIFLSDGATNETFNNALPLSSNINQLKLMVNTVHVANIKVKKVESKCGLYLKWFNEKGAYSYWLFDKYFKENMKTKDLADIGGVWDNLQSITSVSESLGKTATKTLQLTTNYSTTEKDYLLDVTKSPKVEMYLPNVPFMIQDAYNFIGVKVSDEGFQYDNKFTNNKLKISIELPAINTITY